MRRRAWLWILGTLGAIVLSLGGIVWDTHRRAAASLERHLREAAAMREAFEASSPARPPFDGEGVEGDAWEVFRAVLPTFQSLPADEQHALDYEENLEPPDDEALGVIFLKYEPDVLRLREGLNRRTVESGALARADFAEVGRGIPAASFIGQGIAHYHRMGLDRKALEWAELGLGLSQDVGRRACLLGLLVHLVAEDRITWNLRELLGQHRLAARDLEAFARRLDVLDAARPAGDVEWASEEIYMRATMSGEGWKAEGGTPLRRLIGWRQLWSIDVARAQALDLVPFLFEDGRDVLRRPTHERGAEVDRLLERWERERNPLFGELFPGLLKAIKNDVSSLQRRVLLRLAVALAWHEAETGAFPATLDLLAPRYVSRVPRDPLSGHPFGYGGGRLWARGSDGVDNGGLPDPLNPEEPEAGYDVVWTVKRK